jgi:hypothetical protein
MKTDDRENGKKRSITKDGNRRKEKCMAVVHSID